MMTRRLAFRLGAVLLGLLVGAVLMEATLQVTGTKPEVSRRMTYIPTGPFSGIPHPPFQSYKKDYEGEQLYFKCDGSDCVEDMRIPFSTNSLRMRDIHHPLQKPPGTYRILILGDSFSVADGVERLQAWPHKLGSALDQRHPVKRIEVINTAMQAYSTLDQWHVLQHAIRFSPDLIIIGIYINDAMPSTANWSVRGIPREEQSEYWQRLQGMTGANGPWLPPLTVQERALTSEAGLDHEHFLGNVRHSQRSESPLAIVQWFEAIRHSAVQRQDTVAAIRAWWGPWNKLGQLEFTWSLAQLGRLSQEREIPMYAAVFPWMDGLQGDYPFDAVHTQIHTALTEAEIPYVDLLGAFTQAAATDTPLWAHPTDHHPSKELHTVAAGELLKLIPEE